MVSLQNDDDKRFVSRGGIKLQSAIENWSAKGGLNVKNMVCLDVGSSTGGFVDCLLQNGAKKVYAVDTCYGELAWKLRNDPRVVVMERTNILHLESLPTDVIARIPPWRGTRQSATDLEDRHADARDDTNKVDLITIDAGWTKLELILPVIKKFLKKDGIIIALLKPHYEAKKKILRNGIVPDDLVLSIKYQVLKEIEKLGFKIEKEMESPILGGAGNQEYLLKIIT